MPNSIWRMRMLRALPATEAKKSRVARCVASTVEALEAHDALHPVPLAAAGILCYLGVRYVSNMVSAGLASLQGYPPILVVPVHHHHLSKTAMNVLPTGPTKGPGVEFQDISAFVLAYKWNCSSAHSG